MLYLGHEPAQRVGIAVYFQTQAGAGSGLESSQFSLTKSNQVRSNQFINSLSRQVRSGQVNSLRQRRNEPLQL